MMTEQVIKKMLEMLNKKELDDTIVRHAIYNLRDQQDEIVFLRNKISHINDYVGMNNLWKFHADYAKVMNDIADERGE